MIGTAFYRFGEANHDDCIALRQIGYDLADNQIDTLTKAFQATTVACAVPQSQARRHLDGRLSRPAGGVAQQSPGESYSRYGHVNAQTIERLRAIKADMRRELADLWQQDAANVASYLLAAQAKRTQRPTADELAAGLDQERLEKWIAALAVEKAPREDPLEPWRALAAAAADDAQAAAQWSPKWREQVAWYAQADAERTAADTKQFTVYADFRHGDHAGWQVGGQGLRSPPAQRRFRRQRRGGCGDSRRAAGGLLHAYGFGQAQRHAALSQVLPAGTKNISFQVMGSAAVRCDWSRTTASSTIRTTSAHERRLDLDHVFAAGRLPELADVRRADDDVRQSQVSRPAQVRSAATRRITSCHGKRRRPIRDRTSASRAP